MKPTAFQIETAPGSNNITPADLWRAVLARIQLEISQANFATWFKNTKIAALDQDQVVICVPNKFSKEWLENRYHKSIKQAIKEFLPNIKEVSYRIESHGQVQIKTAEPTAQSFRAQIDFEKFAKEKETGLNPKYRFDNFVVGSSNELAHAAAWGVAQKPGLMYNPLFLYGRVGLGKTHLLQAIGNKILSQNSKKKVFYLTSEKFTSEMITAIKSNSMELFKEKYRAADVLIIDDIQFLAGKEKAQEVFFHVFNILYQQNKQVILSSDSPPRTIAALEERLRSRFEGGMVADIGLPDFETRVAILKVKAEERGLNLSKEIFEFIAGHIKNNVRELEGALNRLSLSQKVSGPLSLQEAQAALESIISSRRTKQKAAPQEVLKAVAEFYNLPEKELLAKTRKQEVVRPRQIAMYILREEFNYSYPLIGRRFGGKDHTTAIYGVEKVKKEIEQGSGLNEEISLILSRIYSAQK